MTSIRKTLSEWGYAPEDGDEEYYLQKIYGECERCNHPSEGLIGDLPIATLIGCGAAAKTEKGFHLLALMHSLRNFIKLQEAAVKGDISSLRLLAASEFKKHYQGDLFFVNKQGENILEMLEARVVEILLKNRELIEKPWEGSNKLYYAKLYPRRPYFIEGVLQENPSRRLLKAFYEKLNEDVYILPERVLDAAKTTPLSEVPFLPRWQDFKEVIQMTQRDTEAVRFSVGVFSREMCLTDAIEVARALES